MSNLKLCIIVSMSLILTNCVSDRQSSSALDYYARDASNTQVKDRYKALVILPTTGEQEKLGKDMQRATQMALFDLNADKLDLVFVNSDPHKQPLKRVLNDTNLKDVDIILGPVFSSQTAALKKILKRKNIPVISYSNDIKMAGDNIYIIGFDPSHQVSRVIDYATQAGHKRFGAFLPNSPYGKLIYAAFKSQFNAQHTTNDTLFINLEEPIEASTFYESPIIGEIREKFNMPYQHDSETDQDILSPTAIDVTFYESTISDIQKKVAEFSHYQKRKKAFEQFIKPYAFLVETKESINHKIQKEETLNSDEITVEWLIEKYGINEYEKIARYYEGHKNDETKGAVPYDAILMADSGRQMQMIAAMMPYYNIEPDQVKFLGTGLWDDTALGEEGAIQNAWFAAPNPEKQTNFNQRFETIYNYKPVRLTSLAYDSVALIALLTKTHSDYPFSKAALMQTQGFNGVNGLFRLKNDGIVERELPILAVTKTGSKIVAPAKTNF